MESDLYTLLAAQGVALATICFIYGALYLECVHAICVPVFLSFQGICE